MGDGHGDHAASAGRNGRTGPDGQHFCFTGEFKFLDLEPDGLARCPAFLHPALGPQQGNAVGVRWAEQLK